MITTNSWVSFGPTLFTSNVTEPAGADAGAAAIANSCSVTATEVPPSLLPVVAAALLAAVLLLSSPPHAGTRPIASAKAPTATSLCLLNLSSMIPLLRRSGSSISLLAYCGLGALRRK